MGAKGTGILKQVADETGFSHGYVRRVACGRERNEKIELAIFKKRSEQLAAMSASIRTEALTDFNHAQ